MYMSYFAGCNNGTQCHALNVQHTRRECSSTSGLACYFLAGIGLGPASAQTVLASVPSVGILSELCQEAAADLPPLPRPMD